MRSAKETEKLGEDLAESLHNGTGGFASMLRSNEANKAGDRALVIALNGELGAGKTTFIKGFARGLGVKETITSPTYVFARSYSFEPIIRLGFHKDTLYHLDLYRLERPDDKTLRSFGFEEILNDENGIVLIEWAERLEDAESGNYTKINFDYLSEDTSRKVSFSAP